jgi:hypothetical protein
MSVEIDQYLIDPSALANLQPDVEHSYTSDRDHTLRHLVSKRPQSRPVSGGQKEGFHAVVSI